MPESKTSKFRFDFATPLGLVIGLIGIIGGLIAERGELADIGQATAALIVLGGTLGAVLVNTPLSQFVTALRRFADLFVVKSPSTPATIENLVEFATKARRQGIVSLEADADRVSDPFFRKAMNLAVDGTPLQDLRRQMELEITIQERRAESAARVYETAGGYSPTIGIIGAVMGLIQVMKQLDNLEEVGHGIAVAFVATIYGVGLANLLLLPAASKIRARAEELAQHRELVLDGVSSIVEGLNPKLIRLKLEAYLDDAARSPSSSSSAGRSRGRAA
ncbi:MAG: flagellar motor protein [Bryobacterales bacterium]|nr:flagellar motor protein [Bryobacterales bacterium]